MRQLERIIVRGHQLGMAGGDALACLLALGNETHPFASSPQVPARPVKVTWLQRVNLRRISVFRISGLSPPCSDDALACLSALIDGKHPFASSPQVSSWPLRVTWLRTTPAASSSLLLLMCPGVLEVARITCLALYRRVVLCNCVCVMHQAVRNTCGQSARGREHY